MNKFKKSQGVFLRNITRKSCIFYPEVKSNNLSRGICNLFCIVRCSTGLRRQFLPIQVTVLQTLYLLATKFLKLRISSFLFYLFTNSQRPVRCIAACMALWFFCWPSPSLLQEAELAFQQNPVQMVKSRTVKCSVTDEFLLMNFPLGVGVNKV